MVCHCLLPDLFYWFAPTDSRPIPYWAVLATVVNISGSSGAETENMPVRPITGIVSLLNNEDGIVNRINYHVDAFEKKKVGLRSMSS